MLIVGLTGGIASGKSTVSHLLSTQHHLPIIDADVLARTVLDPGTPGFKAVVSHFGADRVLRNDGTLDRAAIGDIVFRNAEERRWLNGVVHPAVRRAMAWEVVSAWIRGEWCVVLDVPLLIEAGIWKWVGEVVVVYVNERLQLSRLLSRPSDPPLSESQARNRIDSQLSLSSKTAYATSVIDNSGTLTDLSEQVDRLVGRWRKQQGGGTGWWWRLCWVIPPVGLAAGMVCLIRGWWKARGGPRRRARGEVERKGGREGGAEGERIELKELKGGRRRTGSSVMDE